MIKKPLAEKDRVTLTYDKDACGTIHRLGPEMSEVKFDDKVSRYIPNRLLRKIVK